MELIYIAFEELIEGQAPVGAYWKPENIGDYVEGNIYEFSQGTYGKQIMLELDELDEYGDRKITTLPAHKQLQRFYDQLNVGDYIRVTLKDKIEPNGDLKYPTMIYSVGKDSERKVEYE